MTDNSKRTGAALEAHYQFLLWLGPTLEKFPRDKKFMLGDRIHNQALDILECLIEATYTRDRIRHLRRANLGIEKLRFLFRLATDLRVEQQSTQSPLGEPQQEQHRQPEQQQRVPCREHAYARLRSGQPKRKQNARAGAITVAPGEHLSVQGCP